MSRGARAQVPKDMIPEFGPIMGSQGFPGGLDGKKSACSAGDKRDMGLIPGSGRSPAGGHGNPLQCSYLENSMGRDAWQAIVHEVTMSWK